MQQKELAVLLNISTAMVSRLAKRGMPTDTLERAERWRRRHLEPSRIKGVRFDLDEPVIAKPRAAPRPQKAGAATFEVLAELTDAAFARGDLETGAARLAKLRELLRLITDNEPAPRLTLRVWLALLDYMLHEDAVVRGATDLHTVLTPKGMGERWLPGSPWPGNFVISEACDFYNITINGWGPEVEADLASQPV